MPVITSEGSTCKASVFKDSEMIAATISIHFGTSRTASYDRLTALPYAFKA